MLSIRNMDVQQGWRKSAKQRDPLEIAWICLGTNDGHFERRGKRKHRVRSQIWQLLAILFPGKRSARSRLFWSVVVARTVKVSLECGVSCGAVTWAAIAHSGSEVQGCLT